MERAEELCAEGLSSMAVGQRLGRNNPTILKHPAARALRTADGCRATATPGFLQSPRYGRVVVLKGGRHGSNASRSACGCVLARVLYGLFLVTTTEGPDQPPACDSG